MWQGLLQGFVTGSVWSAQIKSFNMQLCLYFHTESPAETPPNVFVNSTVWLQSVSFSCHSHSELQLSGLRSLCGIAYCLPSGLQCLPDFNGTILSSQLKSESKHTAWTNAHNPDTLAQSRAVTVLVDHRWRTLRRWAVSVLHAVLLKTYIFLCVNAVSLILTFSIKCCLKLLFRFF